MSASLNTTRPDRGGPNRTGLPMAGVTVAICRDPVRPLLGAEIRQMPAGISPAMALAIAGARAPAHPILFLSPDPMQPLHDLVAGGTGPKALLRRHPVSGVNEWTDVRLGFGDVLFVTPAPAAGDEGSNPIAMVALLALAIVAPYIAGPIAVSLGGTATGALAAGIGAAISIGGGLLINALFPPSTPSAPPALSGPGETFRGALSGQLAQVGARIPELHGTVRFAPEWIAPPYGEFADNEHLVFALYSLGRGAVQLDKLEFEDTVIWTLADGVKPAGGELVLEIVEPGGAVTLFPATVHSSGEPGGQTLRAENEKEVGETNDDLFIGPFAVCPSGEVVNRVGVDIEWPSALFSTSANRLRNATVTWLVEGREIDDAGTPVGAGTWSTLGNESYTAGTTTPQRISKLYSVTTGRHEVRIRRTNNTIGTSGASDRTIWTGLRGYVPSDQTYDDETVLAIRFKGTAATAQARRLFATATGKRAYWDAAGEIWVTGATNAPEAAIRHIAQDSAQAGLPDHRVDLEMLQSLAETWADREDTFNHRFTGDTTPWEELIIACRAGRAQPIRIGADLTFWRDEVQLIPEAAFAPQDIIRGSLTIKRLHATDEDANAARVLFTRSDGVEDSVDVVLDGVTPDRISELRFEGVDNIAQAWREGVTELAAHRYRRRYVSFTAHKRGRFLRRGQQIAVSHYRPGWGQTGMVVALAADGVTLTADEPFEDSAGGTHAIGLITPDGRLWGPVIATVGASEHELVIDAADMATYLAEPALGRAYHAAPANWILTKDGASKPTRIMFGPQATMVQKLLVLETRPSPDGTVEISAVNDDARVHTAEVDTAQPEEVAAGGLGLVSGAPTWLGVRVNVRLVGDEQRLSIVGPSVPGAVLYRARYQADTADFVELTPSVTPEINGIVPDVDDTLLVEFWAEGAGGEGTRIIRNVSELATPPAVVDDTSIAVTEESDGDLAWTWDTVSGASAYDVEILAGQASDSLDLKRTAIVTVGAYTWSLATQETDGGPFRYNRLRIRTTGTGGTSDPVSDDYSNPAPAAPSNPAQSSVAHNSATVSCDAVTDSTIEGYVVAYSTTNGFNPETAAKTVRAGTTPSVGVTGLQPNRTYYARIAAHDGVLTGLNYSTQIGFTTPSTPLPDGVGL